MTVHSTLTLLKSITEETPGFEDLVDPCRSLDKFYIPTRYPASLPAGIPSDYFTEEDALAALKSANVIITKMSKLLSDQEKKMSK